MKTYIFKWCDLSSPPRAPWFGFELGGLMFHGSDFLLRFNYSCVLVFVIVAAGTVKTEPRRRC
jgi:hypothetical protein